MAEALGSGIKSIALSSDVYHPVIAAIDFGTSNSGYAYVIRHLDNEIIDPQYIKLNKWQIGSASSFTDKAPTTELFKPDKTFDCFGYKAEDKYVRLCATNKEKGWWYFERFKMALYNTKNLSRETTINDAENKSMLAIQVLSAVIAHLKEHILHEVRMQISNVTDDEILYVLAVPAIWSDAAKQFMREAATSKEVGMKTEQLNLVLEPEAASVYCRQAPTSAVRTPGGKVRLASLQEGHKYVIVDLGGKQMWSADWCQKKETEAGGSSQESGMIEQSTERDSTCTGTSCDSLNHLDIPPVNRNEVSMETGITPTNRNEVSMETGITQTPRRKDILDKTKPAMGKGKSCSHRSWSEKEKGFLMAEFRSTIVKGKMTGCGKRRILEAIEKSNGILKDRTWVQVKSCIKNIITKFRNEKEWRG